MFIYYECSPASWFNFCHYILGQFCSLLTLSTGPGFELGRNLIMKGLAKTNSNLMVGMANDQNLRRKKLRPKRKTLSFLYFQSVRQLDCRSFKSPTFHLFHLISLSILNCVMYHRKRWESTHILWPNIFFIFSNWVIFFIGVFCSCPCQSLTVNILLAKYFVGTEQEKKTPWILMGDLYCVLRLCPWE